MKNSAPFLVSLVISTASWGGEPCTPNDMQIDVCRAATNISETIEEGLPLRLNQGLVLQQIDATQNIISMTAVFDYTEGHLVAEARRKGTTLDAFRTSVRRAAILIACRPRTELQAFIELGGELRMVYQFSDRAHFLTVNVDQCAAG
ncbi:hypothetical protein EKL30_13365 [Candidimonas sp. SYP-B2681]|uniref:hypothetical protein n=1 Tax=Candidimonas sp. SYP-B2681 TaxID=2497686 RepID=UPI000F87D789|nr:hypothetical protein [Candidimonas sp. SYP-B2681]RTZ41557.1 hypothetical protein EKL30_13365 [Candidimonas sp. SYP-B2681]